MVKKDPLLEYVEGTGRKYFQLDQKYGTSKQEEARLVGLPPKGTTKVGILVLNQILAEKKTQRGSLGTGSCWRETLRRIEEAWKKAYSKSFAPRRGSDQAKIFEAIAGSRIKSMPEEWSKVPIKLRRRGVPGAMAYMHAAKIIEGEAVWKDIEPGTPLQLWDASSPWGHAPIFYRYVQDQAGKAVAMVLADQWVSFIIMKRSGQTHIIYGAKFSYVSSGSGASKNFDTTSALGSAEVEQERHVCPRTQVRLPGPFGMTKRVAQSERHRGPIGMA